jgi:hypothetical protein
LALLENKVQCINSNAVYKLLSVRAIYKGHL